MKKLTKILAIILTLVMVFQAIPAAAFELDFGTDADAEEVLAVDALFEVPELRTADTKHFRMSDGSYTMVRYNEPVHYEISEDEWLEYDNTLSAADGTVRAASSDANISFSKKSGETGLFTVENDDMGLFFELKNAKSKNARINNPAQPMRRSQNSMTNLERLSTLTKQRSSLVYEDILDNIDLEYIVSGGKVKENIIVKSAMDEYIYEFAMDMDGLVPSMDENGNIYLDDAESGVLRYTIPAGYMFDADGNYSDAVEYTLTQDENGEYTLTVTADAAWINQEDRVFPVKIDPTLTVAGSKTVDTYIDEANPTQNYGNSVYINVGIDNNGNEKIGLIKITNFDGFPSSFVITSAALQLDCGYLTDMIAALYPIKTNKSWSGSTVTWNNFVSNDINDAIENTTIDYKMVTGNTKFDITSVVQGWYAGNEMGMNGFAVRTLVPSNYDPVVSFASNEKNYNFYNTPIFIVNYRDNKGIDSLQGIYFRFDIPAGQSRVMYIDEISYTKAG